MFDRRLIQNFDWFLLLLLVLLAGISILNLYSATSALRGAGNSLVFIRQIYWYFIGFSVFFLMITFNYHLLERLAYPAYFLSVGLLLAVLVIGKVSSGSQRWISLGFLSFQPSEAAKFALVLALSRFFSEREGHHGYRLRDLWQPLAMTVIPCALIIRQPDLGTAVVIILIAASVILFVRIRLRSLLVLIGSVVALIPFVWFALKDYQQRRILTFLDPEMDPLGAGYHINQSKIAIGSGIFWGKGFLKGTQTRLDFLPEQHTDFAFSVWAEEWGFIGSLFLLTLYLVLLIWGLNIAKNSKDKFGSIMAIGFVAIIFWQVFINVGMVTGLLPVVGIPLVLFSYGGSSLVTTMGAMGLLMNISMRRFMFQ